MTTSPKTVSKTIAAVIPSSTPASTVNASPVVEKAAAKAPVVRAKASKPAKAAKPAAAPAKTIDAPAEKLAKAKKPKLVRDSFTIPKIEYAVLDALKQRSIALSQPAKKSELLRAGIKALAALSDADLKAALLAVPTIKTGRPAATKTAVKPEAKPVEKAATATPAAKPVAKPAAQATVKPAAKKPAKKKA